MDWLVYANEIEQLESTLTHTPIENYFDIVLGILKIDRPNPEAFLPLLRDMHFTNENDITTVPLNKKIISINVSADHYNQSLNSITFVIADTDRNGLQLYDRSITINDTLTLEVKVNEIKDERIEIIFTYLGL